MKQQTNRKEKWFEYDILYEGEVYEQIAVIARTRWGATSQIKRVLEKKYQGCTAVFTGEYDMNEDEEG